MLPPQTVYLTLVISIVFSIPFIKKILSGSVKPNLVTWFFWSLAPLIGTFLQLKAGAGLSVLPVFLAGFMPLIILFFALSKRGAYWKITTFDILCGIFSFIALILWILTHNASISILFAILSDLLAGVPTLVKAWKYPETEYAIGYAPGIVNNILGLFIIKSWTFSIYSFGIYFIVLNTTLILFILRKKIFQTI
jgi:hypothetical protein